MQTLELKLSRDGGDYVMKNTEGRSIFFRADRDLLPQPDKRIKIYYPSNVPLDEVKAHTVEALYQESSWGWGKLKSCYAPLIIGLAFVLEVTTASFAEYIFGGEGEISYWETNWNWPFGKVFGGISVITGAYLINYSLRGLVRNWRARRKLDKLKRSDELVLNGYRVGVEWVPDESLIEYLEPKSPSQIQDAQSKLKALRAEIAEMDAQLGQRK